MAVLILDRVWINLMADGEAISAFSAERGRTVAVQGETRTYGGGRRRAITQQGHTETRPFTLRRVTTAQVETLRRWLGQEVMWRDYRGQRAVGVLFDLDVHEWKTEIDLYDVTTTLQEVTWTEGQP
ncbi:hypothetical protein C1I95_14760 [Micromonospora craterilacus]|uniref:Phage tail protein n=1 Tax=Micromonospora craterilacus TaxID=1655439 RepID=A0A2W2EZ57_9ACTN|nr:hypothetical protein [Micromonospora craterilacus]PZG17808.1 hypothetical protein C1I95_14760 [Micromonospora craterilacus]